MITDNNMSNGIPNRDSFNLGGIQSRTQLTQPVQMSNAGRVAPSQNASRQRYNPITPASAPTPQTGSGMSQAQAPSASPFRPNAATTPTKLPTPSDLANVGLGTQNGSYSGAYMGANSSANNTAYTPSAADNQAQPQPQTLSKADEARSAIRGMRNSEIYTLLDEIANGQLKGID